MQAIYNDYNDKKSNKSFISSYISMAFPIVLVFLEIITFLSTDMYLPALPQIADEFGVSQDMAKYTQTAWFLGSMSMQLLLGPITQKFGRKVSLMTGVILFILASFTCATSNSINIFLLARFIQGITVCVVIVAGYATIHELYSGTRAIQILAIMGSVTILAPALGPFFGAVIIKHGDWHNIFALLTVSAMIGLLGVYFVMPNDKINKNKIKNSYFLESIKDYKKIFTNIRFLSFTLINCCIIVCFFIWIVQSPFIIISTYKKSEIYFGIVQLFVFSSFIVGSQLAKYFIIKTTPKRLCDIGILIICNSLLFFTLMSYFRLNINFIILGMLGIALGSAMLSGIWNRLAIESCEDPVTPIPISIPMSHRVAVYSMMVSLFASLGSYLVTDLNDQTFLNLCMLMWCFIFIAVNIYFRIRSKIKIQNKI